MGWREEVTFGNVTIEGKLIGGTRTNLAAYTRGTEYYCDYSIGSDANEGTDPRYPLKNLKAAEARCVANRHDTVYLVAGATGLAMEEALVWDKNYTHLIGLSNGVGFANRARIFHAAVDATSIITLSATGCIFSNFYFSHGNGTATNLTALALSGDRNMVNGVHWAGPQHATEGAAANYQLINLTGGENEFRNCIIGSNTTLLSGTTATLVKSGSGNERNKFENCQFELYPGDTDITAMEIDVCERYLIIKDCLFNVQAHIASVATPAQLLDVASTINGHVLIVNSQYNVGDAWADNETKVYVTNDINVADDQGRMVLVGGTVS